MSERLIIFTVPPPATLRAQDAADLEMLLAGLKLREGDNFRDPDEFCPLSGDRWHIVLERFLEEPERKGEPRGIASALLFELVSNHQGIAKGFRVRVSFWIVVLSFLYNASISLLANASAGSSEAIYDVGLFSDMELVVEMAEKATQSTID